MTLDSGDTFQPSTQMIWAEQALVTLKQQVATYTDRQSRLKDFCRVWQENWLNQADQLRSQMEELKGRLAPWILQDETPRLSIVSVTDEAA